MCSRNTVRYSSHTSFFCGGDTFCEVVRRQENTHEELTGLLEWPAGLCLPSKFTDLIFSFQVQCGNMNILFASRIFCLWPVIGTWILPFFPVICWSYLRTEISVTLSIGNKLYSRHHIIYFSCKSLCWCYFATALNLQTLLLRAKLVYYTYTCGGMSGLTDCFVLHRGVVLLNHCWGWMSLKVNKSCRRLRIRVI